MCPVDKSVPNNDEVLRKLGYAKIGVFDLPTHGQFFWNFRTELEERWDFQKVCKMKILLFLIFIMTILIIIFIIIK